MAAIGDRIEQWTDRVATKWKDTLGGWIVDLMAAGAKRGLKSASPPPGNIADLMNTYETRTGTSDDLSAWVEWIRQQGNTPVGYLIGITITVVQILGLILSGSEAVGREISNAQNKVIRSQILDPNTIITLWRRLGSKDDFILDDLRLAGLSEDRIKYFETATRFYPSPQDLVNWQAKEVFEPSMRSKYGLDDEADEIDPALFAKAGIDEEQMRNFWAAHWEHPSWNQIIEMLHRGQLTEADVYEWYTLVEIPPHWRDKLTAISYNVPTRVDVRRFLDMKTIDETRLREIYAAQGYHGKDLDDYVTWTKVYVAMPDLIAQVKNGWIDPVEVVPALVQLGMTAEAATELYQTKFKAAVSTDDLAVADLTKTEIYKAVKAEKISRADAVSLLEDMGKTRATATLLLDLNAPADATVTAATERQLAKTDIREALELQIIDEAKARELLAGLRYTAASIDLLISIFLATIDKPADAAQRSLSKADVISGVKKGLITQTEGLQLLIKMGFIPVDAEFILSINAEESPFSAVNYGEFTGIIDNYRRAAGMAEIPIETRLKNKADELVRVKAQVGELTKQLEELLIPIENEAELLPAARKPITDTRVKLNRATADLQWIQQDYDSLVVRFKAGVK